MIGDFIKLVWWFFRARCVKYGWFNYHITKFGEVEIDTFTVLWWDIRAVWRSDDAD